MKYLAYGSNLHPLRILMRTPSAKLLGTDVLIGKNITFQKRSNDGSSKCTIHDVEYESSTHVAVYSINDDEKYLLDEAEGLGSGYNLVEVDLDKYGRCLTYVSDDAYLDKSLKPYSWYRALVLIGCEYHEFPRSYIQQIRTVATVDDPNKIRHEQNMDIVMRARNSS